MNFLDQIPKLSADEKKEYDLYFNKNAIPLFRFSLIVFVFASAFFLYLDYLSSATQYKYFWSIRIPIMIITLLLAIASYIKGFEKYLQIISNSYNLLYNLGVLTMIYLSVPGEMSYESYYIGIIIIFIATVPLRIKMEYFVYNAAIVLIIYILIAHYHQHLTEHENLKYFLNNLYFILTSIVVVLTADYVLEIHIRKTFLHERLLTHQKEEIEAQRDREKEQKEKIEKQNKEITASIMYAKRLQDALMPNTNFLDAYFDNFVIYKPRDIVSGDFYWIKDLKNGYLAIAAADCTGHGVPGAFVSLLSISLLQDFFTTQMFDAPHLVLNKARDRIKRIFKQKAGETQKDGMDIALISINIEKRILYFSGANRPLYICRTGDANISSNKNIRVHQINNITERHLIEIKPDRMPVGFYIQERSFTTKKIQLQTDDIIYMFSDGFGDQFDTNFRQMRIPQIRKLLCSIANLPLTAQKDKLISIFEQRKSHMPQTDDVLFIGFKIK